MPWYVLHLCVHCLSQFRSRCVVAFPVLPWIQLSRRGRMSRVPNQLGTRRDMEWQRVDALLESLRRFDVPRGRSSEL
jgi:hypothetical protein